MKEICPNHLKIVSKIRTPLEQLDYGCYKQFFTINLDVNDLALFY